MYIVKNFLLHSEKEFSVLQNKTSLVVIDDKRLTDFFRYIESNSINVVDKNILKHYFLEEEVEDVISFLTNEGLIIKRNIYPTYDLSKTVAFLISNNPIFSEIFNYSFSDLFQEIKTVNDINDIKHYSSNIMDQSLTFNFMNPFNLNDYMFINKKLLSIGSITTKNIFCYNNSIYLSNYHNVNWNNPCPLCFFYNLESHLKGLANIKQYNFQTLVDIIYEKNPKFQIGIDLKKYDYIPIVKTILLELLSSNWNRTIDQVKEISMESYRVREDYAYHCRLCDCYE